MKKMIEPWTVQLNAPELTFAKWVGRERQKAAERRGYNNQNQCGKNDMQIHIDGACGELAFAKIFKLYPASVFDTPGELAPFDCWFPEVGGIDVKTTPNKCGRLNIEYRKVNNPADVYALMCGENGRFMYAGMIRGNEALTDKYLTDVGNGAFFAIPQNDLYEDLR